MRHQHYHVEISRPEGEAEQATTDGAGAVGVLLFVKALAVFALFVALAGCSACALPHEHVQVLADDAEAFVQLWEIEHEVGLTQDQLERQTKMGKRLKSRAAQAKHGLYLEGKGDAAVRDAETGR